MNEVPERKFNCPVEATLSQIGGKYKAVILYHLLTDELLRFNQIQKYVPQATAKMLSRQLRELETDGEAGTDTQTGQEEAEICDWGETYMEGTF